MDVMAHGLTYRWIAFAHLLAAATWLATSVASGVKLSQVLGAVDNTDRLAAWRASRRLSLIGEMPAAGAVLAMGIALSVINLDVFTHPWFHTKLLAVVVIYFLFSWSTTCQKKVGALLQQADPSDPERPAGVRAQINLYRTLRLVAAAFVVLLIFAITVRFGEGTIEVVLPEE